METETMLSTCAAPGQAHRVVDVGLQGLQGGRRGQADGVGEAERRPPGGERRQAKD